MPGPAVPGPGLGAEGTGDDLCQRHPHDQQVNPHRHSLLTCWGEEGRERGNLGRPDPFFGGARTCRGCYPRAAFSPDMEGGLTTAPSQEVTELLRAWSRGEEEAREKLIPLIYKDLRQRARRQMGRERQGNTLQTTALIHEAYLRLVGAAPVAWESRNHFFAIAARMMRRILVDHARSKRSQKRGGAGRPVSLDEELLASPTAAPWTWSRSTRRSRPSRPWTRERGESWSCATSAA